MGYTPITLGIDLLIPDVGESNWADNLKNTTWTNISSHDHTGGGAGTKLSSDSLSANFGNTQASTAIPASANHTVDWNLGNIHVIDLEGSDPTIHIDFLSPKQGALYTIIFIQGSTAADVTWDGLVKWPQGQKYLPSTGNDEVDKVTLYYDGSQYLADWNLDYR